jgi:hypothetical protein
MVESCIRLQKTIQFDVPKLKIGFDVKNIPTDFFVEP